MTDTVNGVLWAAAEDGKVNSLYSLAKRVYEINLANGWFDKERSFGDDIALIHSELSEALEAFRKNDWSGLKDSVQREFANVLVRLLDTCFRYDINLDDFFDEACVANAKRDYRHGNRAL